MRKSFTILLASLALPLLSPPTSADPGIQETPTAFPALAMPPDVDGLFGLPKRFPDGRETYLADLKREAEKLGLPGELADAVAHVESSYQPNATGAAGEVGLMQILPSTASMLGHRGSWSELFEPELNIRYGVRYLARAWQLASGDVCRALMKYRAGHGEERMTPLSIQYCARARAHLAAIGSPLAKGMGIVDAKLEQALSALSNAGSGMRQIASTSARIVRGRRGRSRTPEDSRRFWAAHEARIKAINARLAGSRLRIMSGT
jgi:hypothetical protein